jgi:hypothetical protein
MPGLRPGIPKYTYNTWPPITARIQATCIGDGNCNMRYALAELLRLMIYRRTRKHNSEMDRHKFSGI